MKLSALFSDGMVLQRGRKNLVWGYTNSLEHVQVKIGDQTVRAEADNQGYFEAVLMPMEAGGPYEMEIQAEEVLKIRDVMAGDVFVLGGQSNMELPLERCKRRYEEELSRINDPMIRMFGVAKAYDFQNKREDIWEGSWKKACGEDLMKFSAAGFFTAQAIREEHDIAVGLIHTAIGGTPVKAWCREETVRKMGLYAAELDQCQMDGYPGRILAEEAKREQEWNSEATEAFEIHSDGPETADGTIEIPGLWQGTGLEDFCGSIRLWKEIELKGTQVGGNESELVFGTLIDADDIYVNGKHVGSTGYRYPPRYYKLPAGTLRTGTNRIEVRLRVWGGNGGAVPGKSYGIRYGAQMEQWEDLNGRWQYRLEKRLAALPPATFFEYMASGPYNAVLHPLRKWGICCFLFYQGESNCGEPERYGAELEALIQDWRMLWNDPELPFLYVQLAAFGEGVKHTGKTGWAVLREEQNKTQKLPKTAMIPAYDLGEYNDLHPTDKKNVGKRLARAVRNLVYGEDVAFRGPSVVRAWKDGNVVSLEFKEVGSGLSVGRGEGALGGFWLSGTDGPLLKGK